MGFVSVYDSISLWYLEQRFSDIVKEVRTWYLEEFV